MIFPVFFERGEVVLNGVEVWGIWWQEEKGCAGFLNEVRGCRGCVEGRIVHDDQVLAGQPWTPPRLQPCVEDHRVTRPFEQQRFFESPLHAGGDQRGAWPSMPRDQTVHALALQRVSIPPHRRRDKAAFIDVDGPFAASNEPFPQAQEPLRC